MNAVDVTEMLKNAGGYGVAGIMFWLYRKSEAERIRYREFHEKFLGDLPEFSRAIKDLTDEVSDLVARKNSAPHN